MSAFLTALHALAPVLVVAAVIFAAAWAVYVAAGWHVSRMVATALNGVDDLPLPDIDADDAAFEAWCWQALGIANTDPFTQTRDQIRALPEVAS